MRSTCHVHLSFGGYTCHHHFHGGYLFADLSCHLRAKIVFPFKLSHLCPKYCIVTQVCHLLFPWAKQDDKAE